MSRPGFLPARTRSPAPGIFPPLRLARESIQPQADRESRELAHQHEILLGLKASFDEIARDLELTQVRFEAMMFQAGGGPERQSIGKLDADVAQIRIKARDASRLIDRELGGRS